MSVIEYQLKAKVLEVHFTELLSSTVITKLAETVTFKNGSACCRGSSGKTSRERSRPNDYSEKQKKTAEKRSQKKKKAEDQGDHELDEQNHIDYQFGETEANVHDDRQYNAHDSQFYPDDNLFYQSDDIYTNDPQFQPSIM